MTIGNFQDALIAAAQSGKPDEVWWLLRESVPEYQPTGGVLPSPVEAANV
jgi:hypothetical protein